MPLAPPTAPDPDTPEPAGSGPGSGSGPVPAGGDDGAPEPPWSEEEDRFCDRLTPRRPGTSGVTESAAAAASLARVRWDKGCPSAGPGRSQKCQTLALSSNRHRIRLDIRANLGSNRCTNADRSR